MTQLVNFISRVPKHLWKLKITWYYHSINILTPTLVI